MKLTHSQLVKSILEYFEYQRIFAWKSKTVGVYDAARKVYRKDHWQRKGVPDICAVYRGVPVGCEVKVGKDRLSQDQIEFRDRFNKEDGYYFVARDIEDVIQAMAEIRNRDRERRDIAGKG